MEYNCIIVRYGEIYLKGKNRGFFEKALKNNIVRVIKQYNAELEVTTGRYIVSGFSSADRLVLQDKLAKIPGIYSISPCVSTDALPNEILEIALDMMKDKFGTLRVTTKRADKTECL